MKKILLFSHPMVMNKIEDLVLPKSFRKIILGYIPCDGSDPENEEYIAFWQDITKKHKAKLLFIDNSNYKNSQEEVEKVKKANSLIITGGNTFTLLNNLRKTGLDQAIKDFTKKDNFVLSGFSAGAIVLTPSIEVVSRKWAYGGDENKVNLKHLTGLNIVNFEVLPHYSYANDDSLLKKYKKIKVIQ